MDSVKEAQSLGERRASFHIGHLRHELGLHYHAAATDICAVLSSRAFQQQAGISLLVRVGTYGGVETIYVFHLDEEAEGTWVNFRIGRRGRGRPIGQRVRRLLNKPLVAGQVRWRRLSLMKKWAVFLAALGLGLFAIGYNWLMFQSHF